MRCWWEGGKGGEEEGVRADRIEELSINNDYSRLKVDVYHIYRNYHPVLDGGRRGGRGGEGARNEVPLVSGSHYNWVGGAFPSIRFNFIEKSLNMYDAEKLDFAH